MADLWDGVLSQAHIWKTSLRLASPVDSQRLEAIETLVTAGDAALFCLRFHSQRTSTPRAQFAASVVLHRLGAPEGMAALMNALCKRLPSQSDIAPLLQEAFVSIGPPDATRELLACWPHLPEWSSAVASLPTFPSMSPRVQLICNVWATLRDPLALDVLIEYAPRIPELFPGTVAAFGQMAVRKLAALIQDSDPKRRIQAIHALELIPCTQSFTALVPFLRDPDLAVRTEAPHALSCVGTPQQNGEALAAAIRAGFSTTGSLRLFSTTGHPHFYETLREVVERSSPLHSQTQDTPQAVLTALELLMQAPWPVDVFLRLLCGLLEKPIGVAVKLGILTQLQSLPPRAMPHAPQAVTACWPLLADLSPEVRNQAAATLFAWGDRNGKRFLALLEECRSQGSLLEKLTTLLRGGPDAPQAATQAVQQVQQWMTRLSREAVVRLSAPPTETPETNPLLADPRLPALIRHLLTAALRYLKTAVEVPDAEEALTLTVTAIRVLRRVGSPEALIAQPELVQALHFTRHIPSAQGMLREIAEPVREEAALTLIPFLGAECLPLFLEAASASRLEVQGTALLALGRLGDPRAVPHLQPIASDPNHALAPQAIQALATIRQSNPEMMTLLRGSSLEDAHPETLLRPVPFTSQDPAPELLLRPTQNGEGSR